MRDQRSRNVLELKDLRRAGDWTQGCSEQNRQLNETKKLTVRGISPTGAVDARKSTRRAKRSLEAKEAKGTFIQGGGGTDRRVKGKDQEGSIRRT